MAEIIDFKVAEHFLSYLINGDVSGMTDEDEAAITAFEARETKGIANWHWSYVSESLDDTDFGRCDVTGLGANRAELHLVIMHEAGA